MNKKFKIFTTYLSRKNITKFCSRVFYHSRSTPIILKRCELVSSEFKLLSTILTKSFSEKNNSFLYSNSEKKFKVISNVKNNFPFFVIVFYSKYDLFFNHLFKTVNSPYIFLLKWNYYLFFNKLRIVLKFSKKLIPLIIISGKLTQDLKFQRVLYPLIRQIPGFFIIEAQHYQRNLYSFTKLFKNKYSFFFLFKKDIIKMIFYLYKLVYKNVSK